MKARCIYMIGRRAKKCFLRTIVMACFSVACCLQATAQIDVHQRATSLASAIKNLEGQTEYKFFYADALAHTKVNAVVMRNATMHSVLEQLFYGTDIDFTIVNRIVYLKLKADNEEHHDGTAKKTKRQITGHVVDDNGEPLIGATVSVKGTTEKAVTDVNGNYTLLSGIQAPVLEFSYLGFGKKELEAKGRSVVNASMSADLHALGEVVVTALGIKREKKILGYAVQDVRDEDMNMTGDGVVTSALQGKVAGLHINMSNTGLGGSSKITLRGNSSFTDNNQPLWIVDGVPFTDNQESSVSAYGGYDRGGTSFDINPEDIASVSVLKGPNASALYGSRAGNGVILITTKRGSRRQGYGIRYSGTFTWSEVSETLKTQNMYGQGSRGMTEYITDEDGNHISLTDKLSFGSRLDGHLEPSWLGEQIPYKYYGNKLQRYFSTGFSQAHTVSLGSSNEVSNLRASFGYNANSGIFSGEYIGKFNVDINAGTRLNERLSFDGKVSLTRMKAENRPFMGFNSEVAQLLLIPGNVRLSDLKHYSSQTRLHQNWFGPDQQYSNPYYVRHRYQNSDTRWRAFGFFSADMKLYSWLKLNARYAFDYYHTRLQNTDLSLASQAVGNKVYTWQDLVTEDNMLRSEDNHFEHNIQFLLSGKNTIAQKLRFDYNLGANIMYQSYEYLSASVENMLEKDNWLFNTGYRLMTANNNGHNRSMYSVFGSVQLSYESWMTLDLTARNDWSSTLPVRHNSFFYPSANLSFVVTDCLRSANVRLPHWLTFAKVRTSVAQVGKDPSPYNLYNSRQFHFVGGVREPIVNTIKKNDDLKPETKKSYETGLEMKFFNNRLGFDFTYYHNDTRNQAMLVDTSAPWTQQWVNAGCITNRGYELMLYARPVQVHDLNVDLTLNLAHNNTVVKRLAKGVNRLYFSGDDNMPVKVGAVKGGRLGDIYANNLIKRDCQGRMIVDSNGLPQPETGNGNLEAFILSHPIGNIQPRLLMSFMPSISWRGVSLTALLDMKFGGDIVSVSEGMATSVGTAARTVNRGKYATVNGQTDYWLVVPGVKENGLVNDIAVSAEAYYSTIGLYKSQKGYAEMFVYDASYIKLKEIALSYALPQKWLHRSPFGSLRFSLVARNLCFLMKCAPGNPDGGYDATMFSQALDFAATPYTRTFGFSVNTSF